MCFINKVNYPCFSFPLSPTSLQSHSFILNETKLHQFLWLYNIAFWTLEYTFFWVFVLFSHSFCKQRKQFLSPCMNMLTFDTNQIILRHEQNRRVIFISPKNPIHILCFVISTSSSEKYFLIILSFLKLLFGKHWVKDAVCKQTELNMKDRWSGLCSSDVLGS